MTISTAGAPNAKRKITRSDTHTQGGIPTQLRHQPSQPASQPASTVRAGRTTTMTITCNATGRNEGRSTGVVAENETERRAWEHGARRVPRAGKTAAAQARDGGGRWVGRRGHADHGASVKPPRGCGGLWAGGDGGGGGGGGSGWWRREEGTGGGWARGTEPRPVIENKPSPRGRGSGLGCGAPGAALQSATRSSTALSHALQHCPSDHPLHVPPRT